MQRGYANLSRVTGLGARGGRAPTPHLWPLSPTPGSRRLAGFLRGLRLPSLLHLILSLPTLPPEAQREAERLCLMKHRPLWQEPNPEGPSGRDQTQISPTEDVTSCPLINHAMSATPQTRTQTQPKAVRARSSPARTISKSRTCCWGSKTVSGPSNLSCCFCPCPWTCAGWGRPPWEPSASTGSIPLEQPHARFALGLLPGTLI